MLMVLAAWYSASVNLSGHPALHCEMALRESVEQTEAPLHSLLQD